MPKAVKEKKRLHAPAADFTPIKEEPLSELDLHKKRLEEIQAQLPPLQPKEEEVEEATNEETVAEEPKQLTKDEKRKQRRNNLLQKLNYASMELQKQKDKTKKPEPKPPVEQEPETPLGLITKDLLSTLIETEEKEQLARAIKRGDVKVKSNHMTDKERQDLLKKEVQQFKSVTEHPVFKANPLATIKEHLTNSIALQKAKGAKAAQQNGSSNGNNNKDNKDNNDNKDKKKNKTQAQQYTEKRKMDKFNNNQKDKKKVSRGIQKSPKQQKKK